MEYLFIGKIDGEKMGSCLMIIDIQNGFISPKTEYVIERIKDLLEKEHFDHVIATQFINEEGSPFRRFIKWEKLSEPPETDVLDIVKENAETIFVKNVYSAVNDDILAYLKRKNVTEIFLSGINTDCCILITAADFFEMGIDAKVLSYYSASNGGKESHYAAVRVLKRMIGEGQIIKGKHIPEKKIK